MLCCLVPMSQQATGPAYPPSSHHVGAGPSVFATDRYAANQVPGRSGLGISSLTHGRVYPGRFHRRWGRPLRFVGWKHLPRVRTVGEECMVALTPISTSSQDLCEVIILCLNEASSLHHGVSEMDRTHRTSTFMTPACLQCKHLVCPAGQGSWEGGLLPPALCPSELQDIHLHVAQARRTARGATHLPSSSDLRIASLQLGLRVNMHVRPLPPAV